MPDPNLPILTISPSTVAKVSAEMAKLGMVGSSSTTEGNKYGWEGIKQRLESLLGITGSFDKGTEALRKDLEILMLLDAGNTVGWDGAVFPGAVKFFEAVTDPNSSDASGAASNTRDPRIVLNW
jgi:hypothetical protein